jgi:histidyl-tRNA synthetase
MGLERVLMRLDGEGIQIPKPAWYDVFVTYMGENRLHAFTLVQQLRKAGIKADMDHCGRSLKAQFKYANKTGAPLTAVIGDEEAANGTVKIKRMADGEEKVIKLEDASQAVSEMNSEL